MGQLVDTAGLRNFIERNIRAYVEQVTGPYSRLFAKSPTFVTYYSQDLAQGSADTNLGGSIEIVGPESALRYKAVQDFPIYGINELDVTTAYDEVMGSISGNVQGEVHILPSTIEPFENDLFVISHLGTSLIFRVKAVDADRIEGKAFFRLQFFLDAGDALDLPRQTTGTYEFQMSNVGTNLTPVLALSMSSALKRLTLVEERIKEAYWRAFYDRKSSTLILRGAYEKDLHDNALDLFVSRTGVLTSDKYLGARVVTPVDYGDHGLFEDTMYPMTVFWAAEEARTWSAVRDGLSNTLMLATSTPVSAGSPMFESYAVSGYHEVSPVPEDDPGASNIFLAGEFFLDQIDTEDWDPEVPLRALAQKCLAGKFRWEAGDEADAELKVNSLLEGLNDDSLLHSRPDFFWLGPIVLMEAKLARAAASATSY